MLSPDPSITRLRLRSYDERTSAMATFDRSRGASHATVRGSGAAGQRLAEKWAFQLL
jgi:hypothetical protein